MRRGIVQSLIGLIVSVLFLSQSASAWPPLTAENIMKNNFLTSKVGDSTTDATFHLVNGAGQDRVRETRGMTMLVPGTTDNMRVVEFLSPLDVRGTKTLLIEHTGRDDDIWIYLPAMRKVRRLVSNNKKDSFLGTDFSYGDVIGHKVEDWSHRLTGEETVDGRPCYVVESTPKRPDVGEYSGYSKRVSWIEKESSVSIRGEAYDSSGRLLKKLSVQDVQKVDAKANRWQPMKMISENVQTGHRTIIEFKNFKANVGVMLAPLGF
jgi:outer membrane lipoprotein-sorting protein